MLESESSVLRFLPKEIEEIPFAFWNFFGLGFFLLFSYYGYDLVTLQKIGIEYIVLVSIFLSLTSTALLMVLCMFIRGFFSLIVAKKKQSQYEMFGNSFIFSFGFAIIKYSTRVSPPETTWLIGLLFFIIGVALLVFD